MKVFLGGEGSDELGDWANEPQYRQNLAEMGVIEALLDQVAKGRFTIAGACVWKRIRKYKARVHAEPETKNVLGLMLEAEEHGCDMLVFVRDRDGDVDRQADIAEGIRRAGDGRFKPALVGGVAVEELEAWLLAILGERRAEKHARPKEVLEEQHRIRDRAGKIRAIELHGLAKVPEDAASLRDWLSMATVAFVMTR